MRVGFATLAAAGWVIPALGRTATVERLLAGVFAGGVRFANGVFGGAFIAAFIFGLARISLPAPYPLDLDCHAPSPRSS